MTQPFVVTITGPSCAGKSTLESALVSLSGTPFEKGISTTTRWPRSGEENGVDYYFVDQFEFGKMVNSGAFVESVVFGGNRYGMSSNEIRRITSHGKIALIVCEPHGARQIVEFCKVNGWKHVGVFVDGNIETIFQRMLERVLLDHAASAPVDAAKKVARRFAEAATTEREWVSQARSGKDASLYEIFIKEFNEENRSVIIDRVVYLLRKKLESDSYVPDVVTV